MSMESFIFGFVSSPNKEKYQAKINQGESCRIAWPFNPQQRNKPAGWKALTKSGPTLRAQQHQQHKQGHFFYGRLLYKIRIIFCYKFHCFIFLLLSFITSHYISEI